MSVLEELNEACVGTNNTKKYYNWGDLQPGRYAVNHFELLENFGLKLFVFLENGYELQMPERVFKKFNQQTQIDKMNTEKYILQYDGKDARKGNKLIIQFHKVEENVAEEVPDDDDEPLAKRRR